MSICILHCFGAHVQHAPCRFRANSLRIRQSTPDSGLGVQIQALKISRAIFLQSTVSTCRLWAKMEQLERFQGIHFESHGQNLTVTVLCMPCCLDSRWCAFLAVGWCACLNPEQGSGFRVQQGSGFRVQVQGSEFRVQSSGFRVHAIR